MLLKDSATGQANLNGKERRSLSFCFLPPVIISDVITALTCQPEGFFLCSPLILAGGFGG